MKYKILNERTVIEQESNTLITIGSSSPGSLEYAKWLAEGNKPEPADIIPEIITLNWIYLEDIYGSNTWNVWETLAETDIHFQKDFILLLTNIQTQQNELWLRGRLAKIRNYFGTISFEFNPTEVNNVLANLGVKWTWETA